MSKTITFGYRRSEKSYIDFSESLSIFDIIRHQINNIGNVKPIAILRTINKENERLLSVTDANYEVDSVFNVNDNSITMELTEVDSYRNPIGKQTIFEFKDVKDIAVSTSDQMFTTILWISPLEDEQFVPATDRLRIYEIAYNSYKNYISISGERILCGMCFHIDEGVKELMLITDRNDEDRDKYSPYYNFHKYPELMDCMPCSTSPKHYWWDCVNTHVRMEAFEQMIASVKQKIKEEDQNDVNV